tara:strand:+ start:6444 stop:7226 length:783 start_codon:yes stop_codon:yes gene_type:complete
MLLMPEIFVTFFLGLIMGSFSTALIYRVPRKLSWTVERSSCTNCKQNLRAYDLVPLFSWLSTMGRCRYCKASVSYSYPLIELVCVAMAFAIYCVFGFSIEALFALAAVPFLMALFVIDLRHMILPNQLVFILLVIGLARLFYFSISGVFTKAPDMFVTYFGGAILYAAIPWLMGIILTKILKKDSLGFGDIKFFFVSGMWLGLSVLPFFLMSSGILAILFALLWRALFKKEVFPFGPALIISFFGLLLFQGSFLVQNWIL